MKINPLDAHDRLLELKKLSDLVVNGVEECISKRPKAFKNYPFYIFAHARTDEDGTTKRLIWDPRLTKPKSQTNSMLFMAYPPSDKIKIIWMIPDRNQWKVYRKDNLLEHQQVIESIDFFEHARWKLDQKDPDQLPDEKIIQIMCEVRLEKIANDKAKQATLEALSCSSDAAHQ